MKLVYLLLLFYYVNIFGAFKGDVFSVNTEVKGEARSYIIYLTQAQGKPLFGFLSVARPPKMVVGQAIEVKDIPAFLNILEEKRGQQLSDAAVIAKFPRGYPDETKLQ